jgi:hypothetical protein
VAARSGLTAAIDEPGLAQQPAFGVRHAQELARGMVIMAQEVEQPMSGVELEFLRKRAPKHARAAARDRHRDYQVAKQRRPWNRGLREAQDVSGAIDSTRFAVESAHGDVPDQRQRECAPGVAQADEETFERAGQAPGVGGVDPLGSDGDLRTGRLSHVSLDR